MRRDQTLMAFQVSKEQKALTEALAKSRGVSASAIIRKALAAYVAKGGYGLSPAAEDALVAGLAPDMQAQFDAVVRSLEALNDRVAKAEEEARRRR